MGLYDLLQPSDRPAIIEPSGRSSTFTDLHHEAGRLGGYFHRQLGAGGRVLLMQPVGIDLYNVVVGLFAAGATGVLVDPSAGYRRVRETLRRIGVRGVVGPWWAQALRLLFPELRGGHAYLGGLGGTPYARAEGGPLPQGFDAETPALITFTTGSTGRPKAVARSHAFLVEQHRVLSRHLRLGPGDVDLATLPVFALSSLASGATVVFPDSNLRKPASVDPARVLPQVRGQRVSHVTASPAFLAPLARALLKYGDSYPYLRGCFTGGARVSAQLGRDLCIAFPGARVEVVYGSTEAEPIAALDVRSSLDAMEEGEREGLGALVGTPVPEIAVRVVRPGTLEP
ncbi:MAG: AMP-binding protein, partial [Deltaproteobacteria bacterium]|nr:AMP-binding protein [Deltaproteobacteria bacterium]